MHNAREICTKITSIYPETGTCGQDIDVSFNKETNTWLVHMEDETHELDHFLELSDAQDCIEDKQCISLGLEIAQMRNNLQGKQF